MTSSVWGLSFVVTPSVIVPRLNRCWAGFHMETMKVLAAAAGPLQGVSICPGDRTGVWFEGTAHLADALEIRGQPGDSAQAAAYLADLAYAQAHGPNEDGLGIMAASKDGLTDCAGDSVYASLHTGTTAWYILAASAVNPLSTSTPVSAQ